MGVKSISIINRALAVVLMVIMACSNPLQIISSTNGVPAENTDVLTDLPTEAAAAEKKDPYVREVRLAVDKDAAKAKQILIDDGYEVIDQDLNEEAGSFWNSLGDQAVYMGIKRTKNPDQAIREMKTMNMLGKYNFAVLEQRIKEHKSEAEKIYDKLKVALAEFRNNYQKGDLAAKICYKNLQKIREDDSGMTMGDLFLSDISEEDLLKILLESNTYLRASVIKSLSIGIDEESENGMTWIDRVSKVTSYKSVLKQYSRELFNKDTMTEDEYEHVQRVASHELDGAARTMLSHWDEIRKVISGGKDVEEVLLDFEEDLDEEESEELITDTCDTAVTECLRTVKYGKKSLYHLFMVSKNTFEEDITKLYPLVYAFSPGQRSILEMIDPTDLIQGAIIRINEEHDGSDLSMLEEEVDNTLADIDVMSIYSGVDRSMYREGAAMTSTAIRSMSSRGLDYNRWEDFDNALLFMFAMGSACFCLMGLYFIKAVPTYTDVSNIGEEFKDCAEYFFVKNKSARKYLTPDQLEEVINFEKEHGEIKVNTKLKKVNRIIGVAMVAISVVLAGLAVYEYIKVAKKEHNVRQLPIPETIVDFDMENEAGKYLTYNVVKWNYMRYEPDKKDIGRADRADLNGDGGKEWLALFTSKDKSLGDPILADSIVAKTGENGGKSVPGDEYVPLTMFGSSTIQNLVDDEYSYYDEVGGIWMWYVKGTDDAALSEVVDDVDDDAISEEDSDGEIEAETDETLDASTGAAVDTTGSNIGGGSIAIIVTACVAGVFIIGMICMYFIRRKKVATVSTPEDKK